MMKNRCVCLVAIVLLGGLAARADAQTLGDAARLEAERRAKLKEQARVVTTEEVKSDRPAPVVAPAPKPATPADSTAAQPADEKTDDKAAASAEGSAPAGMKGKIRDKRPEEHWRERAKSIRDRIERLQADGAAVEGRIAELQALLQSASGAQATAIAGEIEQANKDLARFNRDVRFVQDEWRAFEERAKAAKINPAWIH